MAKDWMAKLLKLEGAVIDDYNPYANVLDTESPSLNFTFGNTWGLPKGYSLALWGPQKGGKSLISNMLAAKLHKDDPTAFVIKFNTEGRELLQFGPEVRARWGIDNKRYIAFEGNEPSMIFDKIEKDIKVMVQEGMNLGLVIIDSINQIRGRRSLNAESIDQQLIGDQALTLQEGFSRILQTHRACKFGLVVVCQARAEFDQNEIKRRNFIKMAAPAAIRHYCEYFMYVEENKNVTGRVDEMGNPLTNLSLTDLSGKADQTGHKIKVQMKASSCGPKGRVGMLTLDYREGLINVHEEVFKLGVARGVILKPSKMTYVFGDKKWTGKQAMLEALKMDPDLQKTIIKELKRRDLSGEFVEHDKNAASMMTDYAVVDEALDIDDVEELDIE